MPTKAKTKHQSGDWKADGGSVYAGPRCVALAYGKERHDIARLIAAAPELYEVSRRLVKVFGDTPPDELAIQIVEDPSTLTDILKDARAAIARASSPSD